MWYKGKKKAFRPYRMHIFYIFVHILLYRQEYIFLPTDHVQNNIRIFLGSNREYIQHIQYSQLGRSVKPFSTVCLYENIYISN